MVSPNIFFFEIKVSPKLSTKEEEEEEDGGEPKHVKIKEHAPSAMCHG